jgi:hypothetical protein
MSPNPTRGHITHAQPDAMQRAARVATASGIHRSIFTSGSMAKSPFRKTPCGCRRRAVSDTPMAARKTTRESTGGAVAGHAAGWAPRRRPSGDCAVYNSGSMPARRSLARGLARCSCAPATLRLGDVRLRIGLRALSARRVPVHSISEGPENYSRFLWPPVEKGRVAQDRANAEVEVSRGLFMGRSQISLSNALRMPARIASSHAKVR